VLYLVSELSSLHSNLVCCNPEKCCLLWDEKFYFFIQDPMSLEPLSNILEQLMMI
jgi:hypothetical protein